MSDNPLHIKARPKKLSDIIGNTTTIASLNAILKHKKDIPHVYLFQGSSGCGKTTLARIMAYKLGCSARNIVEKNNADFRGIDAARDIIAATKFLATGKSGIKAFILDECHMGTRDFQNALLKTLEDTPKHVYFMLCTTEPEKLIKAVRNRCSVFPVSNLTDKEMAKLINNITEQEALPVPPNKVVDKIIEVSNGSPRHALIILDQIKDLAPKKMLSMINDYKTYDNQIKDLCQALIKKSKWYVIADILKNLTKEDPEKVRYSVIGYCNAVLLNKDHAQAAYTLSIFCENTFMYTGRGGLTNACYISIN